MTALHDELRDEWGIEERPDWLLPATLLLAGLFFPTSLGGSISTGLYFAHQMLLCAMLWWLGTTRGAYRSIPQMWNAMFLVGWPLIMTLLWPYAEPALGGMAFYLAMASVFALNLHYGRASDRLSGLLALVTLAMLIVGGYVLAGDERAGTVLTTHYAIAYPELVPFMLTLKKPVFTFGSHSIAGFFYFLLFYLNLETFRARRKFRYLLLAIGCILIGAGVASVTALILTPLALVVLLLRAMGGRWLVVPLVLVAGLTAYKQWDRVQEVRLASTVVANVESSLTSEGSGFGGRFRGEGALRNNLAFIREHPLRPIGFTYQPEVFYGDNGPVEYLTRGSVPLLLAVYAGLWAFLFRGLRDRSHAWMLFGVTLAFEMGFTILNYHRYQYLLPFSVMYLNSLPQRLTSGRSDLRPADTRTRPAAAP